MEQLRERGPQDNAILLLYDNIHDFKSVAEHVESEIRRLGIRYDCWEVVPASEGRTHHEVWVSMKTVSHFNLGTALELMLKLLLNLNNIPFNDIPSKQRHSLVCLYDKLPDQHQLEIKYRKCPKMNKNLEFLAFVSNKKASTESEYRSPGTAIFRLRGLLEYLDENARLWKTRYSYEQIRDVKWRYYLNDISILIDLIDLVMCEIHRDELS